MSEQFWEIPVETIYIDEWGTLTYRSVVLDRLECASVLHEYFIRWRNEVAAILAIVNLGNELEHEIVVPEGILLNILNSLQYRDLPTLEGLRYTLGAENLEPELVTQILRSGESPIESFHARLCESPPPLQNLPDISRAVRDRVEIRLGPRIVRSPSYSPPPLRRSSPISRESLSGSSPSRETEGLPSDFEEALVKALERIGTSSRSNEPRDGICDGNAEVTDEIQGYGSESDHS